MICETNSCIQNNQIKALHQNTNAEKVDLEPISSEDSDASDLDYKPSYLRNAKSRLDSCKLISFRPSLPLLNSSDVLYTKLNQSQSSSIDSTLTISGDIDEIYDLMASSSKLSTSNSIPCRDNNLEDKNSFQLGNKFLSSSNKPKEYSFEDKKLSTFVSGAIYNDDVKRMSTMQENMELCPKISESLKANSDSNTSLNDTIGIEETTYNARLANENNYSNNNDGIIVSSAETLTLPSNKHDNVTELSHLSTTSCETLVVSHCICKH